MSPRLVSLVFTILLACVAAGAPYCFAPDGLNKICICKNFTKGLWLSCEPIDIKGYNLDMDYLGAHIPENTYYLRIPNFSYNVTIQSYQFNSTSLETLRFENGKFIAIEQNAFKGLPNLLNLELSHNPGLEIVSENLVSDSPKLVTLELSGSDIQEVDKKIIGAGLNLKWMSLERLNLTTILDALFSDSKDLEFLDLSNNDIHHISESTFQGIAKLQHLNLSANDNVTFGSSPFKNLPSLKTLRLADLFSKSPMPRDLLFGVKALNCLDLGLNGLTDIPYDLVNLFGRTLKELILDGNNVETLDGKFVNLTSLETLSFQNASVRRILQHAFVGLGNLRVFHLNENKLIHIQDSAFEHLTSLEILNLSKNGIEYIGPQAFLGLSNLRNLDLTKNQLKTFSTDILNSIPKAAIDIRGSSWDSKGYRVSYNPMNCNCTLLAAQRWLKGRNKSVEIVCHEPKTLQGEKLMSISEGKFRCRNPIIEGCCSTTLDVRVGASARITCNALGTPSPEVKFIITSGSPFPPNRTTYEKNGTVVIVSDVRISDAKTVQCEASSILGTQRMTFTVNVSAVLTAGWVTTVGVLLAVLFILVAIGVGVWFYRKRGRPVEQEREFLQEAGVQYSSLAKA